MTCWDWFCVFDGMGWVWSSHVDMHFWSLQVCDGFHQQCLSCILCIAGMEFIWSKQVGIFLCPRWYACIWKTYFTMEPCWNERIWSTNVNIPFVSSPTLEGLSQHALIYILCLRCHVNTIWVAFCVLAGMDWVWSMHVEMQLVASLTFKGFVQHMLKYIWCPSWQGFLFCVLAGMG